MFSEEELRDIRVLKRGDDYVEVLCGCTSHRYGDSVAKLRVLTSGALEIACECIPCCSEAKLTPAAFERHSGRESSRKWKNNIWIIVGCEKVPVGKTALLKYYNQSLKNANGSHKSGHRDEFIICTECKKERRFRLRSEEECRIYHDALTNAHWKCSDIPFGRFSCDGGEERASRRLNRGCLRSSTCTGCPSCVCEGCEICRFSDCSCQSCIDFTRNAKNA